MFSFSQKVPTVSHGRIPHARGSGGGYPPGAPPQGVGALASALKYWQATSGKSLVENHDFCMAQLSLADFHPIVRRFPLCFQILRFILSEKASFAAAKLLWLRASWRKQNQLSCGVCGQVSILNVGNTCVCVCVNAKIYSVRESILYARVNAKIYSVRESVLYAFV